MIRRQAQVLWLSFVFALVIGAAAAGHAREPDPLQPLAKYAASYAPCKKPVETCMELPQTPEGVAVVLRDHAKDDAYKRHVTLVLLKLYGAQLQNYRKSFDIRRDADFQKTPSSADPLLEAFASFSGVSLKGEFVSSDLAYTWVANQPMLLSDPQIAAEVKRISARLDALARSP